MTTPNNATVLVSINIQSGISGLAFPLSRSSDGTVKFTDANGVVRRASSSDRFIKQLFDSLNALV